MINEGIKSKERVSEFGEVYTPENIVNDMLDLVKDESYRIDATFLEPSCGTGNFLVEILRRKLETVSKMGLERLDRNIFIALSSIYAIDILPDNIKKSKTRMLSIVKDAYINTAGTEITSDMLKVVEYVLDTNIICGDCLTGLKENNKKDSIMIAEWSINGDMVNRKDYEFNNLNNPLVGDMPSMEYGEIHFKGICSDKKNKKRKNKKSYDLFDEL